MWTDFSTMSSSSPRIVLLTAGASMPPSGVADAIGFFRELTHRPLGNDSKDLPRLATCRSMLDLASCELE